jgi:methionyl-tRNA formyltransferase
MGFVISFVLKQLEKFESKIDWEKVKADIDVRVRALVPGTWFDDEAVELANTVIDAIAKIMASSGQTKNILSLVANKKYSEAGKIIQDLVLKAWKDSSSSLMAQEQVAQSVLTDFVV